MRRANGRASWSYLWTPGATGSALIRSRAVDDSGISRRRRRSDRDNRRADVPVHDLDRQLHPANPSGNDGQPIETGVKSARTPRDSSPASVLQGTGNTGTHTAHLWTSAGALLGTTTFTAETASGWQQANFSSPIAISANTTYVASYFSAGGGYAFDDNYFASEFASAPLRALADGADGPNGVYNFGSSGFPTTTFQKANYWVDVVFATSVEPDTTAPTVASVTPVAGANGVTGL